MVSFTPYELVRAHLNIDESVLAKIPSNKTAVVPADKLRGCFKSLINPDSNSFGASKSIACWAIFINMAQHAMLLLAPK